MLKALSLTTASPLFKQHHPPLPLFKCRSLSLVRMLQTHLTIHSSNLEWHCLLNLLLSHSPTILGPPVRGSFCFNMSPHSFCFDAKTPADDIHVNGPADKGLFTQDGLNPPSHCPTEMQVERTEKGRLVFSGILLPRDWFV